MAKRKRPADPLADLDQWTAGEAAERTAEIIAEAEQWTEILAPAIDWSTAQLWHTRQMLAKGSSEIFEAAQQSRALDYRWEQLVTEWRMMWTQAVRGPAGKQAPEIRGGDIWSWSDVTVPRSIASRCWGHRTEGHPPSFSPLIPDVIAVALEDSQGAGLRLIGGTEANELGAICQPGHPCRMTTAAKAPPFELGRPTVTTVNLPHYLARRKEAQISGGSVW